MPIAEAVGKRLNVPISLSYHASGIKVDEVAGNIGLGWALNAGGVITRSVRGLQDESQYGYLNFVFDYNNYQHKEYAAKGYRDTEPDEFFFNFNGYSGKFFLKHDGSCGLIP